MLRIWILPFLGLMTLSMCTTHTDPAEISQDELQASGASGGVVGVGGAAGGSSAGGSSAGGSSAGGSSAGGSSAGGSAMGGSAAGGSSAGGTVGSGGNSSGGVQGSGGVLGSGGAQSSGGSGGAQSSGGASGTGGAGGSGGSSGSGGTESPDAGVDAPVTDAATDSDDDDAYDSGSDTPPDTSECPQLGKGCCALLINFVGDWPHWLSRGQNGVDVLHESLQQQGCHVHFYDIHASGLVRPQPERFQTYDMKQTKPFLHRIWNMTEDEEKAARKQWEADMLAESAAVRAKIAEHEQHLKEGQELGVFHIYSHGDTCGPSDNPHPECGSWMDGVDTRNGMMLDRNDVLGRLWKAAHHNICEQVVLDSSCFGKCSQVLGKNLNQAAVNSCAPQPVIACCNRTGWRGDAWMGSSAETNEKTWDWPVRGHQNSVDNALSSARDDGKPMRVIKHLVPGDFPASYIDSGYGQCPGGCP